MSIVTTNTGTGLVVFEGLGDVVLRTEPARLTEKVLMAQHSAASIQTFKA